MATNKQQSCMITIVFPAASDEEAIGVKQKIEAITEHNPEARVDFRLMTVPKGPPTPNG